MLFTVVVHINPLTIGQMAGGWTDNGREALTLISRGGPLVSGGLAMRSRVLVVARSDEYDRVRSFEFGGTMPCQRSLKQGREFALGRERVSKIFRCLICIRSHASVDLIQN